MKVVPSFEPDGIYLDIFCDGAHDRVGPVAEGGDLQAVLEREVLEAPKGISTRLRKAAARTEKRLADMIGGRRQPGSGATSGAKGDVRKRGEFRLEAKTTTTGSYRVTRQELEKIRAEASRGEVPGFVITFISKATLREEDAWVLIPLESWRPNAPDDDS